MSSTELITEIPSPTGVMSNVELIDIHRQLHESLVFYKAEVAGITNELVMNATAKTIDDQELLAKEAELMEARHKAWVITQEIEKAEDEREKRVAAGLWKIEN